MTIHVDHFSDILCIWAYVAQIRMDELKQEFGEQVHIDHHVFPVFGDVPCKMERQWNSRGGIEAYNKHVQSVAAKFDHINIHPTVWSDVQPSSSMPAHLYLSAIQELIKSDVLECEAFDLAINAFRQAFFVEAKDISNTAVLHGVLSDAGFKLSDIQQTIDDGTAFAKLERDIQLSQTKHVKASPTLIFNEDRQRLTGNVGYKIIQANIRELIDSPVDSSSWC
ncbi:hypothetical protein NBRC116494_10240 [Aurantivibrio plasticivorans]